MDMDTFVTAIPLSAVLKHITNPSYMKKILLLLHFVVFSKFASEAQIVSIRPNHALTGTLLPTTITLATGVMQNSTPCPNNGTGIYLQQGATIIYEDFGSHQWYYYYNMATSTLTWYDSLVVPFRIPVNAPGGYYDVVVITYEYPLLTADTNKLINGFYVEEPTGTISGTVYFDSNQNGVRDLNEPPMGGQRIQFSPTNDIAFTNNLGEYSYFVDTGTYTTTNLPPLNFTQTSLPLTYTASIPPSASGQDFGIFSALYAYEHYAHIDRIRFRCLTTNNLGVMIGNQGILPSQDKVSVIKSSNVTFNSSTTPPDFINGDTLTWIIPSVAPSTWVYVGGAMNFTAPSAGQTVSFTMIDSVFDMAGTFVEVKLDVYSYMVACSYDPNDKHASPEGVMQQHYTPINSELTYLVNFQNTGNDYAYDVYIFDTLDSDLDLSTFEVIGSSHELNTQITATGAIRFNFFNIMLPDSGLNEPGSHGWVLYKIRPNAGLPDPTEITNTSYIVFDFNSPIITNTTLNTMTALQYPESEFNTADVSICETNCILFNNLSTSGTSYEWIFAGGDPSSSTAASPGAICYSTDGVYDVTLITTNALGSDTLTQSAYINVANSPSLFTVIQSGDSLIAPQGFSSYEWYYNNVLIANDTLYYHVANQNGDYGVVVGNANGCQLGVNITNFNVGVNNLFSDKDVEVYPNPSKGTFEISISSIFQNSVAVSILDNIGNLIREEYFKVNSGMNKIMIQENDLASGIYTLKLMNDKKVVSKKLIINR